MSAEHVTLLLASGSPRRRELLARLGVEFSVIVPDVDEAPIRGEAPAGHVVRVAAQKARAVAARRRDDAVLAADTIVVLAGRIFGKPASRAEAGAMLEELAGRTHEVLTGTTVLWAGREAAHLETARVTLVPHDEALYRWYVATGEVDDKAGAYAVQGKGAVLVSRVEGNVQAVMGLPLSPLPRLFERVGLRLSVGTAGLRLSRRGESARRAR
jgi:septum formation protein